MKKFKIYCWTFLLVISCLSVIQAVSNFKAHDFQGQCLMCHIDIPGGDKKNGGLMFVDEIDKLCDKCHKNIKEKSHPINIKPDKDIPLAMHLDKNGRLTCSTCHDVHKEDKTKNKAELPGFLWGHVTGRAFCSLCHNKEILGAGWRHQTTIPYAHPYGKLVQNPYGGQLDKYSVECLSCHDNTISKFPQVNVQQGLWRHSMGDSHPIGINYPRSNNFIYPELLPREIKLFDGKIGCLSCHEIYSRENNMLVMNNKKSVLCLSCHKK